MSPSDPRVEAVLDVISPREPLLGNQRFPIFEWPHETTPTDEEMQAVAERIVKAVTAAHSERMKA